MRLSASAISGAAVVLAIALVAYFRPGSEPPVVPERETPLVQPIAIEQAAAAETPTIAAPPPAEARGVEGGPGAATMPSRAPLPGETPSTPIADLLEGREGGPPRQLLLEGEHEFAAQPVDAAWAPGAEADLLAAFAEWPGLKLIDLQVECRSTMCRVQLTQPSGATAADGGPRPFNILRDSVGLEPRFMNMIGDASGSMKAIAYLWRDGFAPPKPELGQPREAK